MILVYEKSLKVEINQFSTSYGSLFADTAFFTYIVATLLFVLYTAEFVSRI